MAYRERRAIDVRGLKAALLGRVAGTPPAAASVGLLSSAAFDLLFGALVLAAVVLSLIHRKVQPTPRAVFVASVAAGFMGTVSSIGGPPLALVYQNAEGPRLRATLAGLFLMGCLISLVGLAAVGRLGVEEFVRGAVLLPGVPIGLLASGRLVRVLDRSETRPFVLALSSAAAVVVLVRAFS
jgi:uncharacterized membrane protein YfcA